MKETPFAYPAKNKNIGINVSFKLEMYCSLMLKV